MNIEEISFINDVIQDNRANARIEQDYNNLVFLIFNNAKLNWNNDGLILNSDEKLFDFLKIVEPKIYENMFKKLKNEKQE